MKAILISVSFFAMIALTLSCGENSPEPASDTADGTPALQTDTVVAPEEPPADLTSPAGPAANLEMCYATSIHLPENRFGPENVFDGNIETSWVTMPGAGANEGIFFSFEEVQLIHSMEILTVAGDEEYREIDYFMPYINGMEGSLHRNDGDPLVIDAKVKSLFLKIVRLSGDDYHEDGELTDVTYSGILPVGISEITFTVPDEGNDTALLELVPVGSAAGTISASSSLEPVEAYNPDFLFDSRTGFGWADGNTDSTGEGEFLSFAFDSPRRIEKVRIWNGYQRSYTHFQQNERAASVAMGAAGDDLTVYHLEDSETPQTVPLEPPFEGTEFRMEFAEIYRGSAYTDLVISELRFHDGEEWFILDSGGNEARKMEMLAWADTTAAGVFMDRNLHAQLWENYDDDNMVQNLVIRSNGSFVLWKSLYGNDAQERTYADGNWQVLDQNSIRIFGKIHHVGEYGLASYDPYSGVQPENDPRESLDRTSIFSDTLHFDENHMESSRGLFFLDFQF